MVLRKSFYIRWSAGRSPRVHEVNPGRDPSPSQIQISLFLVVEQLIILNEYRFAEAARYNTFFT